LRLISRKAIVTFGRSHPQAISPLDAWYRSVLRARWQNLAEARKVLPHADPVDGLTVFNIGGNKYRLVARVNYRTRKVFIRAILTHAEYDKGEWKE
jgi:mRNA interferase HigB